MVANVVPQTFFFSNFLRVCDHFLNQNGEHEIIELNSTEYIIFFCGTKIPQSSEEALKSILPKWKKVVVEEMKALKFKLKKIRHFGN